MAQFALCVVGGFAKEQPAQSKIRDEHTLNHIDCPGCRRANIALQADQPNMRTMRFREARKAWELLRAQSTSLKPRTHEATNGYLNALEIFFGQLRLCDITPGHIRGYQFARLENNMRVDGKEIHPWKQAAGNSAVNHEISALSQMLTHCTLWERIRPYYFPLHQKTWSPRDILSESDEEILFRVASQHPEAALAYWVACITNNTTAAGSELRGLQLKNIFLRNEPGEISEIYIPEEATKNTVRPRKISLNGMAKWAIVQCYGRAIRIGCFDPDHYLFPFRIKRNLYDPTRQASRTFLRKSWAKLREATGFYKLCPHDLRHMCITRMLEQGVKEETITAIAGHRPHSKMLEYYAHHRSRVKYDAVMAIDSTPIPTD